MGSLPFLYSLPSAPAASVAMDSIHHRMNIFRKTLFLYRNMYRIFLVIITQIIQYSNDLHGIYIAFVLIGSLKMVLKHAGRHVWAMCKLYDI